MKLNLDENVILISTEEKVANIDVIQVDEPLCLKKHILSLLFQKDSDLTEEDKQKDEPTYDTPKEKQCWAMYCKMTEKGERRR